MRWVAASIIIASGLMAACSSSGAFVWGHELDAQTLVARDVEYRVRIGDMLTVRVFNQDGLSTRSRVRSDGRIAFPLIGEVLVVGKRPDELAAALEERLKPFVVSPNVSVTVEESVPTVVSVVGEVGRPGVIALESASGAGVLQALAAAGGVTEYADTDSVFVIRKSYPQRIRFTYDGLAEGIGTHFQLRSGDIIVVE